jgi:hypothetical protein
LSGENPRHSAEWGRLRSRIVAAARARGDPCALCGRPIDYTLSGRARWGPTVDHEFSIVEHPDLAFEPSLLRIAHRQCNLSRGGRLGKARQVAARNAGRNGGISVNGRTPADDGARTPSEVAAWRQAKARGDRSSTGWRW